MDNDQHPTPPEPESIRQVQFEVQRAFGLLNLPSTVATPVLLAVSGGPDSLCMADVVLTLRDELHLEPAIAHLDHGLRGEAAQADAEFVRQFADAHHVHCTLGRVNVGLLALEQKLSVEAAARHARYRFLAETAGLLGIRHIAVAHNSDDQVETILLRLLRGTGVSGLRGMRPVQPLHDSNATAVTPLLVIRPLLGLSRVQIEDYCRIRRLHPRRDLTNVEQHYTRNRIRHELLPLLEQYNPGIRKVLVRLAETAATDMEIVDYATRQAFAGLLTGDSQPGAGSPLFNRDAWRNLPAGLQRAVLREAVRQHAGDVTDLKFAGIEEARDVLNSTARSGEIAILANLRIIVRPHSFQLAASSKIGRNG